jgi:acyl-CoA synthetase (AMP-forming)/AMP-acid ligase II
MEEVMSHAPPPPSNQGNQPANIASVLPTMAAQQPDQPAIYYPRGRDASGRRTYDAMTYAELDAQSDHIAQSLTAYGIGRGVRAVLMVKPSLEFFALTFGMFKAGAVPVMIDPGIGLKNIKKCLAQARPEAFIGIPAAHAARVLLRWGRRCLTHLVTVGRKRGWGGATLDELKRATSPDQAWRMVDTQREETAAILFTSGSTGTPKGVVYKHGTFLAQVSAIRDLYGIQPGEVDLPTFPLFALFDPALGMTTVIPEMDFSKPATIDPTVVRDAVETFGITNMFGSPAVLNSVSRWAETNGVKFHSLRRVISAGAPVPATTLARMRRCIPADADIVTPYGATESLPVASVESRQVLEHTAARTDAGAGVCVGPPVRTIQATVIEISDKPLASLEAAPTCAAGEIGEIVVHGSVVTESYFEQPEATALAKVHDADGKLWHRMGDVGYLDEAGLLWFCGRKSHRVATAAGTLFSVPVEGIFNTHPDVFRSALIGVPSDDPDKRRPAVCVELEPSTPDHRRRDICAELRAMAREHLMTSEIQDILLHPAFPVDIRHNAKINRPALARWAARMIG